MTETGTMLDTPRPAQTLEWAGTTFRTILSASQTGGAMSIVDSTDVPDNGPPRHVHGDADETFVVLTGACEFYVDGATFVRGPGESAFVPRGREHTYRVIGDAPGRHLVIFTPGGFEGWFADMSRHQYRIPEDMDLIEASANRFQMFFTGPPLGG